MQWWLMTSGSNIAWFYSQRDVLLIHLAWCPIVHNVSILASNYYICFQSISNNLNWDSLYVSTESTNNLRRYTIYVNPRFFLLCLCDFIIWIIESIMLLCNSIRTKIRRYFIFLFLKFFCSINAGWTHIHRRQRITTRIVVCYTPFIDSSHTINANIQSAPFIPFTLFPSTAVLKSVPNTPLTRPHNILSLVLSGIVNRNHHFRPFFSCH